MNKRSIALAAIGAAGLTTGGALAADAPHTAAAADGAATPATGTTAARGTLKAVAMRHVRSGSGVRMRGALKPGKGHKVAFQVMTRRGWKTVDRSRTTAGGRFRAAWKPRKTGTFRVRARFAGDRRLKAASARAQRVHVYRAGFASWYGPGLYGNKLGCGGTLTPGTLGVANKRLPCGTRVTLRYRGRSATVRVVDRGPYVGGREWDLTAATKSKLGFGSTGTVWSTK